MPPVQLALPIAMLFGAVIAVMAEPVAKDALRVTSYPSASLLDDGTRLRMLRISIEPGAGLPWHRDGRAMPQGGYLVAGELRLLTLDGRQRIMRPGDALADSLDIVHGGSAGPEGATVVVFYAREA